MDITTNLFLFTVVLLLCSRCTLSANQCPDCGTTPIPYPLSTDPSCGDPSYKIRCVWGLPIFDTFNNSYPINSIDASNKRLVLQPALLLPDTCVTSDFVHLGVNLNISGPFNISSNNIVIYLNCSEALDGLLIANDESLFGDYESKFDCSSNSLCHTLLNGTKDVALAPCQDGGICCSFDFKKAGNGVASRDRFRIRLLTAGCRAYKSFVNLDPNLPVDQWPTPGLELQWG